MIRLGFSPRMMGLPFGLYRDPAEGSFAFYIFHWRISVLKDTPQRKPPSGFFPTPPENIIDMTSPPRTPND